MQEPGFEPGHPLRDKLLKLARLTTSLLLLAINVYFLINKPLYIQDFFI